jgi:hypothetical protein
MIVRLSASLLRRASRANISLEEVRRDFTLFDERVDFVALREKLLNRGRASSGV